jgi:host factor-I protein
MSTELDTGLPSIRLIQSLIRDGREVEIKLLTDDLVVGKVLWQDPDYLCVIDHYNQQTLVFRPAIAFIKPKA